jgi:DNA-binding transcriptional regulator YdaS (Cro superfamily)
MNAIQRAIKAVGSQAALGRAIGVSQPSIHAWVQDGAVTTAFAIKVAEAAGWTVTPHELRPDIYPHPDDGLPAELRAKQTTTGAK